MDMRYYIEKISKIEEELKYYKATKNKQIELLENENNFLKNEIIYLKSSSSSKIELLENELNYIRANGNISSSVSISNNNNNQLIIGNSNTNNDNSKRIEKLESEISFLGQSIQHLMEQFAISSNSNYEKIKSLENEINNLKDIKEFFNKNNNINNNNSNHNNCNNTFNQNNNSSNNNIDDTKMKVKEENINECINSNSKNKKPMVVVLSGFVDDNETKKLNGIISKFGGRFETFIGKNVTHVITREPIRSEKVMGGSAAGAWLLKPSFLLVSNEKNRLEKEEDYQWKDLIGDPKVDIWIDSSLKCQRVVALNGGRKLFEGSTIAYYNKSADSGQGSWLKILSSGDARLVGFDHHIKDHLAFFQNENVTHFLNLKIPSNDSFNTSSIINSLEQNSSIQVLQTTSITKLINDAEYLIK